MDYHVAFIIFVIGVAFAFDFINGFHDAANSIATIVYTGVLTPRQAVLWAAFFNFIAFLFFNSMVAKTIGYDLINRELIDSTFLLAALTGAIFWNLLTWYLAIPSSSSHALIGGLTGAALVKGGFSALKMVGFIKVAIGIFISPILGVLISFILTRMAFRFACDQKNQKKYMALQLVSSAFLSLTHGGNDAQKTMGIIAILLLSESWIHGSFYVPFWVVISCNAMMSLGTLMGGWRIVETLGAKITKLNVINGCTAQTAAAVSIFASTELGIPVSTTHTVTGAVAGAGLSDGLNGMPWLLLRKIFFSWLLTLPASALVAAIISYILNWV